MCYFSFYINTNVTLNDNGTLFHLHFEIFSQNLFETLKVVTLLAFNVLSM